MRLWTVYAHCYDFLRFLHPYQRLQGKVVSLLRPISCLRILDLGCGTGNTILEIQKLRLWKTEITAVDSSSAMLNRAKYKLRQSIKFAARGLDEFLKNCQESFDRIIAVNSLYGAASPEFVLKKIYEFLEDGGIAVVANPCRPKPSAVFKEHLKIVWQEKNFPEMARFVSLLPVWCFIFLVNLRIAVLARSQKFHFLPPMELETLFKKAGFKIITSEIVYGGTVALFSVQKDTGATVRRAQTPEEIEAIYALRYGVYCHEIKSLKEEDYPDGKERDRFDPYAMHFMARNRQELTGCIRLLPDYGEGFLLEEEFSLPEYLAAQKEKTLEISRWIVAAPFRGNGLWRALVEEAIRLSRRLGYTHLIMVAQEKLWQGLKKRGWEIELWSKYRNYHNTYSAPGEFFPPQRIFL